MRRVRREVVRGPEREVSKSEVSDGEREGCHGCSGWLVTDRRTRCCLCAGPPRLPVLAGSPAPAVIALPGAARPPAVSTSPRSPQGIDTWSSLLSAKQGSNTALKVRFRNRLTGSTPSALDCLVDVATPFK